MALKLSGRSNVLIYVFIHSLILPFMVYLVDCIVNGWGVINPLKLYLFGRDNLILFLSCFYCTYLVFFAKRFATQMLILTNLLAGFVMFKLYFLSGSIVAMIYSSLNLIISILFIALWLKESESSFYLPKFSANRLGSIGNKQLPVYLSPDWGEKMSGRITSCSEDAFFIVVDKYDLKIPPKSVSFEIHFENKIFAGKGEVVSSFSNGVGIFVDMEKIDSVSFNWKDLII